jgi:hypothetical protein
MAPLYTTELVGHGAAPMAADDPEQITHRLVQWAGGDRSALDLVRAAVYGEISVPQRITNPPRQA